MSGLVDEWINGVRSSFGFRVSGFEFRVAEDEHEDDDVEEDESLQGSGLTSDP
jgi:hypothetical protein